MVVVLGLLLLPAVSAHAQTNYPVTPTCGISRSGSDLPDGSVVRPGDQIDVTSINWQPNSTVEFTFLSDPVPLGTAQADGSGTVRKTVSVPDVDPGEHRIRLSGTGTDGRPRTIDCPLVVLVGSNVPTTTSTTLRSDVESGGLEGDKPSKQAFGKTGLDYVMQLVQIALALLAVGLVLYVAARRVRQRPAA